MESLRKLRPEELWQINEFLPLLAHALLESLDLLININELLTEHVRGMGPTKKNAKNISTPVP